MITKIYIVSGFETRMCVHLVQCVHSRKKKQKCQQRQGEEERKEVEVMLTLLQVVGRLGMPTLQQPKPLRRDWLMKRLISMLHPSKSGTPIPSSCNTSWRHFVHRTLSCSTPTVQPNPQKLCRTVITCLVVVSCYR